MSDIPNTAEKSVLFDPPQAWITYIRKDGRGRHNGTIATNPDYVKAHSEWAWQEIALPRPPLK